MRTEPFPHKVCGKASTRGSELHAALLETLEGSSAWARGGVATNMPDERLILASRSSIRHRLLQAAGIRHTVDSADVEEVICEDADPGSLAADLARAKAMAVSARRPGELILGADQVFELEGRLWPKPEDGRALRAKLRAMSGKTHSFHCGLALVRSGKVVAECVERARVRFRVLSPEDVEDYAATEEGLGCAGGYRLEEGGVRLIEEIEGSHFTVLGLPMIRLVGFLRELGLTPGIYRGESTS